MGKKKEPFHSQLKTLTSIEESIQKLIDVNQMKSKQPIMFRSVFSPHTPSTYMTETVGKNNVLYGDNPKDGGLKDGDFLLSESNPNIVLKSKKHGLSFNSTLDKTMDTLNFLGKFQKKGTKALVAYWIDEENKTIPPGLAFEVDQRDSAHYLLTVTEEMTVTKLVSKLKFIAQRMTVMKDLPLEAYKS